MKARRILELLRPVAPNAAWDIIKYASIAAFTGAFAVFVYFRNHPDKIPLTLAWLFCAVVGSTLFVFAWKSEGWIPEAAAAVARRRALSFITFFLAGSLVGGLMGTSLWLILQRKTSAQPILPGKEAHSSAPTHASQQSPMPSQTSSMTAAAKPKMQVSGGHQAMPNITLEQAGSSKAPVQQSNALPAGPQPAPVQPTPVLPPGTMRTGMDETDPHKRMVLQRLTAQHMLDTGHGGAPDYAWLKERLELLRANWSYYDENFGLNEVQAADRLMADQAIFTEHVRLLPPIAMQITFQKPQLYVAQQIYNGLRSAGWNQVPQPAEGDSVHGTYLTLTLPPKLTDEQRSTAREFVSELWRQGLPVQVAYGGNVAVLALPKEIKTALPINQETIDTSLRSEESKYLVMHWPNDDEADTFLTDLFGRNTAGLNPQQKFLLVLAAASDDGNLHYLAVREAFIHALKLDPMTQKGEAVTAMNATRRDLLDAGLIEYGENQTVRLPARYRKKLLEPSR